MNITKALIETLESIRKGAGSIIEYQKVITVKDIAVRQSKPEAVAMVKEGRIVKVCRMSIQLTSKYKRPESVVLPRESYYNPTETPLLYTLKSNPDKKYILINPSNLDIKTKVEYSQNVDGLVFNQRPKPPYLTLFADGVKRIKSGTLEYVA